MINLTIECKSSELDTSNHNLIFKGFDIQNVDAIAKEISDQVDPGLLVTENNQVQFLDAMELKFIKQYLRERES